MNAQASSIYASLLDNCLNEKDNQASRTLFATTLDKTEEISIHFNTVKACLKKGLNVKNNTIKDFLPIIEATQQFEQLIETYWLCFEAEDKIKLEEIAHLINQTSLRSGVWNYLRELVKVDTIMFLFKNIHLFLENIYNPQPLLDLISAQVNLAQTILDLREQDQHISSEEKQIVLSEKDSELLIAMLENPPVPSEGLLAIFQEK